MNIFINAVKRAEENARECEEFGFTDVAVNWVNNLPSFLMRAELMAFVHDAARSACFMNEPKIFRNYTP